MVELTVKDIEDVVKIIDVCVKRGAFEGSEMMAVGTVRERFTAVAESASKRAAMVEPEPEMPEAEEGPDA